MAHAANISQLTDGLVRGIVVSGHEVPYSQLRDTAAKSLRSAGHARTNQFDVASKLEGLIEKFSVLNRDDLADALRIRLDGLPSESKWVPEILSLFLTLSDRPLEKTKLEDVKSIEELPQSEKPVLTWQELVAEDSSLEEGLWDDIERGHHSSEDDASAEFEAGSDATLSTETTSVAEDDVVAIARLHVTSVSDDVEEISLFRDHTDDLYNVGLGTSITELTLIRETLSMLHGLPTSVYSVNESGQVRAISTSGFVTAHADTQRHAIRHFAEVGTTLNILRRWTQLQGQLAYVQSCQAIVQQLSIDFDRRLASLERLYLSSDKDVVVSIVEVRARVEKYSTALLRLSKVVQSAQQRTDSTFALIDELYDAVCLSELANDHYTFAAMLPVLAAGLKTYLRTISNWIRHGFCHPNDATAVAVKSSADCELGRFWQDRFALRRQSDGTPHAPKLMRSFAESLFALGKSRAFLNALDHDGLAEAHGADLPGDSIPNFRVPDNVFSATGFLPLSQLLVDYIESWLAKASENCTPALRRSLLDNHSLLRTLCSLNQIFCSENGAVFQPFADTLFYSMDNHTSTWKNSFLMTELAQSTLGTDSDDNSIIVRVDDTAVVQSSIQQLAGIDLRTTFAWPVQNITRTPSPDTYSQIFTLLLQVYRAKYMLRRQLPDIQCLARDRIQRTATIALSLHLRFQFMAVVDVLHAHITTVSARSSQSVINTIETAADIDAMASAWEKHRKQLDTTMLLAEKLAPLHRAVVSYLELCERFVDLWKPALSKQRSSKVDATGAEVTDEDQELLSRVKTLHKESETSLSFIVAGLHGVARAGGNNALDILAERLEWIVH